MEWFDSALALALKFFKLGGSLVAAYFIITSMVSMPFLTVFIWKLNRNFDRYFNEQDKKRKAKVSQGDAPLPPRTYAENMADHERAMKRLSEGLES